MLRSPHVVQSTVTGLSGARIMEIRSSELGGSAWTGWASRAFSPVQSSCSSTRTRTQAVAHGPDCGKVSAGRHLAHLSPGRPWNTEGNDHVALITTFRNGFEMVSGGIQRQAARP